MCIVYCLSENIFLVNTVNYSLSTLESLGGGGANPTLATSIIT